MGRTILWLSTLCLFSILIGLWSEPTSAAQPYLGRANMQCGYPVSQQDLFYNYYVGTPHCGSPAQLYLCPRPTPELVGHTYYTYQPLLPHEMLYRHDRTYFRVHPDGTGVKTRVRWR